MKRVISMALFVLLLTATGCQSNFVHELEKSESSVTIKMDSLSIVVEIVDEDIIHISKQLIGAPERTIPNYTTVLKPKKVEWKLRQSTDKIVISTDDIFVTVSSDGVIEYFDEKQKHLLSETNERTFISKTPVGDNRVSQAFVAGDEALYGLGQFQSGIMNWRGVSIRLDHFNQEVAIPFLVSTKKYGILWNNYAITDFNLPQDEILFDEDGEVSSEKIDSSNQDVENVVTSKSKIDREANIRRTKFTPDQSGLYTFLVVSDTASRMRGKISVTIDEESVIDFSTIWVPFRYSGKMELEAGREYEVVFQNAGASIPGNLYYNKPDFNKTIFSSQEGSSIDYYLLCGDDMAHVAELNHKLTGQAPMFEKKAYGFWQCRERYHSQAELLENARELRRRKIPVDVIIQDWFYWPKGTKGPEWDRAIYPDPAAMASELHDLNMNLMVSVWPFVNNDPMLAKYDLVGKKLGDTGNINFYDPEVAKRYYSMLSDSMFHFGVNSIWLDGSEPQGRPDPGFETGVGRFSEVNSTYSLLVTKTMYEGKRAEYPKERVMNLTRSAYTGQQRYGAVTWSGDVQSTWKQFREQISAGLNFTMAGVPYWTHDAGGFFRDSKSLNPIFDDQYTNKEFIELYARWFQFGAFSPIFRVHGYVSQTEIWRYGKEFESMARKFIDLRYQLLPYIYSEAWKITTDGSVLMAPLAYQYPDDKRVWEIDDQLLFGESLMAAFVTEYGQRKKDVYLPEGDWYDFWSSEKISGGRTITADAAFDKIPLFVKAGSIVPFGPKLQYATEHSNTPLHIRVYPGANAKFTLYLDDNMTTDYMGGDYTELEFSYNESKGVLEIEKEKGSYIDFKKNPMRFIVAFIGTGKSQEVVYSGGELKVTL